MNPNNTQTLPPAGWYPDPAGSGGQAWWNGTSWGAPLSPPPPEKKGWYGRQMDRHLEAKGRKDHQIALVEVDRDHAGQQMYRGAFGGKAIEVYSGGFVRVANFVMRKSVPFEKLLSIQYSDNVSKKSGVGRAAGAVFTGGVNLITSNKRGDVFLTIVTEGNVYTLHEGTPNVMTMRDAQALAAAGQAVLA